MMDEQGQMVGSRGHQRWRRRAELRNFGLTIAAGLAVLGALLLWRGRPFYPYFFAAGGVFLVLGLAAPLALGPFRTVWMRFAELLGWVMTRVVMVVIFFVVVTPIGLVARASGRDLLQLKLDRDAKTYWLPVETEDRSREHYERQY
jgi:hypothetical protein